MTLITQRSRAELVRKTREVTEVHLTINGWFPARLAPGHYGHARWGIAHAEHGCWLRDSNGQGSWERPALGDVALPMEWSELRNGSFWKIYGVLVREKLICKLP